MIFLFAYVDRSTTRPHARGQQVDSLPKTFVDEAAAEIRSRGGTIHPAVGNQVLASWSSDVTTAEEVVDACVAALAVRRMTRMARIGGAPGSPLQARIAIDCGSPTLAGAEAKRDQLAADFLIAAKRLDAAADCFGTEIVLGDLARSLAGARIHARELDPLPATGWLAGPIYELLATADRATSPSWLSLYEAGLAAYRSRDFAGALGFFQMVLALRQGDRPSQTMLSRCQRMLASVKARR